MAYVSDYYKCSLVERRKIAQITGDIQKFLLNNGQKSNLYSRTRDGILYGAARILVTLKQNPKIVQIFYKSSPKNQLALIEYSYKCSPDSFRAYMIAVTEMNLKLTKIIEIDETSVLKFQISAIGVMKALIKGHPSQEFSRKVFAILKVLNPDNMQGGHDYKNHFSERVDRTTLFLLRLKYGEKQVIELIDLWLAENASLSIIYFEKFLKNFDEVKESPLAWAVEILPDN